MPNRSYFAICYDQDDERKNNFSGYDPGAADGDHTEFCLLKDCCGEDGCCPIDLDGIERKLAEKESSNQQ